MRKFVRELGAALAASMVLTACTASPPSEGSPLQRQKDYFADMASAAESAGATRLQIDTLRKASQTGDLTPDMVTALYDPLFACLESVGAAGQIEGTKQIAPGFSVPDYVISFDADMLEAGGTELDAQVRGCQDKNVEFVWRALFLQPEAVEARADEMMTSLPSIRECLAGLGIELSDEPNIEEVQAALGEGAEIGTHCFVPGDYSAP